MNQNKREVNEKQISKLFPHINRELPSWRWSSFFFFVKKFIFLFIILQANPLFEERLRFSAVHVC